MKFLHGPPGGRTVISMHKPPKFLYWLPHSVRNLLYHKGIHNRVDLARELGVSPTTVYSRFHPDWSGHATAPMLIQVAWFLDTPLNTLVAEPAADRHKIREIGYRR